MIIRAKTPLRISFAGGGTDVSPYPEEHGGRVLSCTIDKYCYCTLVPRSDDVIAVTSLDYDSFITYGIGERLSYDGKLDLVKAALNCIDVGRQGLSVFLHSDVPPGAGLGASSSITVALVGTLKRWKQLRLSNYQIAKLAYRIEREEVGIKGGWQDQYAATFGGFNLIEFFGDKTVVTPLKVPANILNELQYRLMLCYTGKRRLSADIIEDQVKGYIQKKGEVEMSLHQTKKLATDMKDALLLGEIDEFGMMLHQGWLAKKNFSSKMTDPDIDELYEVGTRNGALGGKLLGAGGGGYILFLCEFDKRHKLAQKMEEHGGKVMNFTFDFHGLQTWEVKGLLNNGSRNGY